MSYRVLIILPVVAMLAGCIPKIEVAAPKEPLTINMNVKIDHDIHIKADKDIEPLLPSQQTKNSSTSERSNTSTTEKHVEVKSQ